MKSDEVVAVLDALARHLGTTADFLIPLFARKAIGAALAELVCISLIALIGLRAWRWKPNEATIKDSDGFVLVVKWGVVVVAIFFGSVFFVDAVATLASPQAAAIADILSKLHGK